MLLLELLLAFEVVDSGENVERKVVPPLLDVLVVVTGALFYVPTTNAKGCQSVYQDENSALETKSQGILV